MNAFSEQETAPDPATQGSTLLWTEFPDVHANTLSAKSGTWAAFIERIRTVGNFPTKEACPLVKLARFGTKRSPGGSIRHDDNLIEHYGIEGDYDAKVRPDGTLMNLGEAQSALQTHGIRAIVYPSSSWTAEKPFWRVICPLSKPHLPADYERLVKRLNGALGGLLSAESFVKSQIYYFGALPTNDYKVLVTFDDSDEGSNIDELHELDSIAIDKPKKGPKKATEATTGPSTWAMQSATEYADPQTVQDLRSALGFLKPDSDDRKTWIDVAHYLRKLGNTGFELWDTWSQASDKYDPLDQRHRWHTIYPDTVSVGYKAVFERAQAAGWVNTRLKVDPSTGEINQHIGGFGHTQAQVDEFKAADPNREFSYDNDTGSWHEVRKPEPTFTRVSLADVFTNPPPDQEYVWEGLIPRGVLTLLSANGGTGKSLKSLQLAAHRAVEKPFLGLQTKRTGKTLYFSAEDSTDIVRRRFASVCKADSLNPAEVSENLIVLDATDNPALYVEKMAAGVRGGEKTHAYNKLAAMIKDEGVDFLIVDNASDSYDADPIDRQRVGEFVRLLVKLVKAQQGTVLLLAHVNRNTARGHGSNSQDFADSAAWHNKARSRLFLKAEKENSPDLILEHQKANLGRKREPLLLTMREYGGVVLRGAGVDFSGLMARQEGREDYMAAAALLKILAEYESREQYASPSPTARNNVFSLLRADPLFKKLNLSAEDVKRLVQQSSRAAWIEPLEYKSAHTRKYCQRWTVTAKGKAHIDVCAPTSPTSPT